MKAGFPTLLAAILSAALPARATVSIEFQLGGIEVPAGSIGVLVADVADNGFTSPTNGTGSVLSVGETIGTDDVVIAILESSNLPDWGAKKGFASHLASIDYASLGVAEGQDLILHVFPDRDAGDPIRAGEPHLSYRTGDLGQRTSNSTMGFTLPRDGGAYLLAYLGAEQSGNADLAGLDLSPLGYGISAGTISDQLSSSTSRHTYFFNVATPGFVSLDGPGGSGLRAELHGPDGRLIAASNGKISMFETLAAGFHTLVVFRSGGPGPIPYGMAFSNGDTRSIVPDVAVGPSPSRLIGRNLVRGAPGQTSILHSVQAVPVAGFATIGNRSGRPDTLAVRGNAGSGLCRINYFGPTGSLITAQLVSGSFRTDLIDSGDPGTNIRIQFTPDKRKLVRKVGSRDTLTPRAFSSAIRADSMVGPPASDTATLQARIR
jgi:hypothetical protein